MNTLKTTRPYFLWDYALTEKEVRDILQGENETEKIWLISRILESARYEDVWQYLTLQEIQGIFSKLKLKPPVRRVWAYALDVWNTPETDDQSFTLPKTAVLTTTSFISSKVEVHQ